MRRRAVVVAGIGLGVMVLSGCGAGTHAASTGGVAASSDAFEITQRQVDDQVTAVLDATGQAPGDPPAGLAMATVQRMVQGELIDSGAAELGVLLTDTQVKEGLDQLAEDNGGVEALTQAALQAGIPASELTAVVRTNLLAAAIGRELDGEGTSDAQLAATTKALAAYSQRIDVEVAPRYGTWDDATLSITPGSTVSSPAPGSGTD